MDEVTEIHAFSYYCVKKDEWLCSLNAFYMNVHMHCLFLLMH